MAGANSPKKPPGRSPVEVEELLRRAEGLVERVAAVLRHEGMVSAGDEDLYAYGRQGLLEAALRYEHDHDVAFERYAYYRVRGAMLDGVRKMGSWTRRGYERIMMLRGANAAAADHALGDEEIQALDAEAATERLRKHMAAVVTAMSAGVFCDHVRGGNAAVAVVDRAESAEEQMAREELRRILRDAVDALPAPENVVVRRFYLEGENMDSIAAELGHSRSWVSRVHTRALARMSARLRNIRG